MAGEHVFDAAASGPTPNKIVAMPMNTFIIVVDSGFVIYANNGAGGPDTAYGGDVQTITETGEPISVKNFAVGLTS